MKSFNSDESQFKGNYEVPTLKKPSLIERQGRNLTSLESMCNFLKKGSRISSKNKNKTFDTIFQGKQATHFYLIILTHTICASKIC